MGIASGGASGAPVSTEWYYEFSTVLRSVKVGKRIASWGSGPRGAGPIAAAARGQGMGGVGRPACRGQPECGTWSVGNRTRPGIMLTRCAWIFACCFPCVGSGWGEEPAPARWDLQRLHHRARPPMLPPDMRPSKHPKVIGPPTPGSLRAGWGSGVAGRLSGASVLGLMVEGGRRGRVGGWGEPPKRYVGESIMDCLRLPSTGRTTNDMQDELSVAWVPPVPEVSRGRARAASPSSRSVFQHSPPGRKGRPQAKWGVRGQRFVP